MWGVFKAIGWCLGTLRKIWCYTPRIPGISRGFQSYMVWNLVIPRKRSSQDDSITCNRKQKEKRSIRIMF